jgi:N-acetylmuramoyl-L-alanine amidase
MTKRNTFNVFLDPGHGGYLFGELQTKGKRTPPFEDGNFKSEGEMNRAVVAELLNLSTAGNTTLNKNAVGEKNLIRLETWGTNFDLSPIARARLLNKLSDSGLLDLIVSIHHNADNDDRPLWQTTSFGHQVFTSQKQTEMLVKYAGLFLEAFGGRRDSRKQDVEKPDTLKLGRRIDILDSTRAPSILVECGFMDSLADMRKGHEFDSAICLFNAIEKARKLFFTNKL